MGFNNSMNNIPIIDFYNNSSEEQKFEFWNVFGTIASNAIGRALLYRILIEVRRTVQTNKVCYESGSERIDIIGALSKSCICIHFACEFKFQLAIIRFSQEEGCKFEIAKNGLIVLAKSVGEKHVSLFHEMLHWYHFLSDEDYLGKVDGRALCPLFTARNNNPLFAYYYGGLYSTDNEATLELRKWGQEQTIDIEEFRTIVGINGDLSENAFRFSMGLPLRIFHSGAPTVFDEIAAKRCRFVASKQKNSRYIFASCSCCCPVNGFLCLGIEDRTVVAQIVDESKQCCRNYQLDIKANTRQDDFGSLCVCLWSYGIGHSRFFKGG
jgi:hypothetical protein